MMMYVKLCGAPRRADQLNIRQINVVEACTGLLLRFSVHLYFN